MDYSLMGRGTDGNVYELGGGGMKIRYMEKGDYTNMSIPVKDISYTSSSSYTYTSSATSTRTLANQTGIRYASFMSTLGASATATVTTSLESYGSIAYNFYGSVSHRHSGTLTIPNVIEFPIRHTIVNSDLVDCVIGREYYVSSGIRQVSSLCSISINKHLQPNNVRYPNNFLHPVFENGDTAIKITLNRSNRPEDSAVDYAIPFQTNATFVRQLSTGNLRMTVTYTRTSSRSFNNSNSATQWANSAVSNNATNYSALVTNAAITNSLTSMMSTAMTSHLSSLEEDMYNNGFAGGPYRFSLTQMALENPTVMGALRDYQITEYK